MRKKDLIAKLEEIDGNPEILLFNGITEDWHHVEISDAILSRVKSSWQRKLIAMERIKKTSDEFPAEEDLAMEASKIKLGKRDYEFNDYAVGEMYEHKKVKLLVGKLRGKKSFDRFGVTRY